MLKWCPGKTIWLAQNDLVLTETGIRMHLVLPRPNSSNQEENFVCRLPGSQLCLAFVVSVRWVICDAQSDLTVVEIGICIHLALPGPIGRSLVHWKSLGGEESSVGRSAGSQLFV